MKFLVLLAIAVSAVAAADKKYVFDYMKPALSSAEVIALLASKEGPQWPTLNGISDEASRFDCSSKKQPGFYADVGTQCQVFHRCDVNGNLTSYLCVNTTVFNQLTLVCDYWFNVDCDKSVEVENLANSRLYTDQPLFDSPPADYVAPSQTRSQSAGGTGPSPAQGKPVPAKGGKATTTKKPAAAGGKTTPKKGGVKVGGSASISAGGRSDEGDVNAAANANEAGSNVTDQQPDKATTAAADAGASTAEAADSSATTNASTAADATNKDTSSAASADQSTAAADQSTAAA